MPDLISVAEADEDEDRVPDLISDKELTRGSM
jgi:hypothetical protein